MPRQARGPPDLAFRLARTLYTLRLGEQIMMVRAAKFRGSMPSAKNLPWTGRDKHMHAVRIVEASCKAASSWSYGLHLCIGAASTQVAELQVATVTTL